MPFRDTLPGLAAALLFPVFVFITSPVSEAVIVPTGDLTPTYDSTDPWEVGGVLVVGYNAPATLGIDAASVVNSTDGILAGFDPATAEVTVNGVGSAWNNSASLLVGRTGAGTLNIEDGGAVTNQTFAYLGHSATATGTINVTGVGSLWDSAGEMYIGRTGAGILNIENGANAIHNGVSFLGFDSVSTGTVTVTGTGSMWDVTGDMSVGHTGMGTMNITKGASVSTLTTSYLGLYAGSTGEVTVTGTGSVWDTTGELLVGLNGAGTLNIENGATVNSDGTSRLGRYAGSTGTVTVTGTGSVWDTNDFLHIGSFGTGILNTENGATVNNYQAIYIGDNAGSTGTANVIGSGSVWNNAYLYIGFRGNGTLNILDGGEVNNQFQATIGLNSGSYGQVNVDKSRWNIPSDDLTVGHQGTGELEIRNNGQVYSDIVTIGGSNTGIGTVHVSNGSVFELNEIYLGYLGHGTLLIEDGGRVGSSEGTLGYRAGSVGAVTVTGIGSTWISGTGMTVGNTGEGTLRIEDAAMVSVSNLLTLGQDAEAIGTINLTGGTLDLNGGQIIAGLGSATFNFTGGTLKDVGQLSLGQPFVQAGGTLAPGGSIGGTLINGEYTLTTGTLEIELGGVGDPIDLVSVTGDIDIAALGTTLDLRALGPMAAGTYTLMESTAGSITGMFENIDTLNLFGVNVSVLNTGTTITVTLDSDLIFADPNLDGFVGIDDLNLVLGNWNQSVTPGDIALGDLNGDGFVGIDDLNAILGNWNAGAPPTLDMTQAIPEPGGVAFVLLGAVGACRLNRARSM